MIETHRLITDRNKTYRAGKDAVCPRVKLRNLLTGQLDGAAHSFNLAEGWYERWVVDYTRQPNGKAFRVIGNFSAAGEFEPESERVHAPYQLEDRVHWDKDTNQGPVVARSS